MRMNPYLIFNGRCEVAFKFYEQSLGGKIEMRMTHGESPTAEESSPESRDKIMHACIKVGNNLLMLGWTGRDNEEAKGFYVSLGIEDSDEAERLFQVLSQNGEAVHMPMQETFRAVRFGMLVDQFGSPWMVNCEKPK